MIPDFLSNPHDKYVRDQLSDIELARVFLGKFLDQQLVAALNLETLTLVRDSYVDEELKESYADLVYKCEVYSGKEVEICILLEHKSYVPAWPRIQLIQYLLNAWKAQMKAEKLTNKRNVQLRPVIPVVLYHGEERWKDRSFTEYFHSGEGARVAPYIPAFLYDLIDLNTYSAEEVAEMNLGMVELTVMALKFSRDLEAFLAQFGRLSSVMEIHGNLESEDQRITAFFVYLYSSSQVRPNELFTLLQENMPETLKNRALSTYEQMILPYKKELEEKEVIIEQALEEARQNRARVVEQQERVRKEQERVRKEQERVRQRNIAIIKLALKYDGPINEMAQLTGLSEQEVRVIIEQIKNDGEKN